MQLPPVETDSSQAPRILVVEDDPGTTQVIRAALEGAGYEIWPVASAEEAQELLADKGLPHLAVVDIVLPGMSGLELCGELQSFSDIPVIMLSVVDEEETVIDAIERFAEDYITKPFNPAVLVARVKRVLRRIGDFSYTLAPLVEVDESLAVDFVRQRAVINGRTTALTPTEAKLLHVLMRSAGETVRSDHLLARVWATPEADENTLRVHIHRLRQKIEATPSRPRYVVTERGAGYSFLAPR